MRYSICCLLLTASLLTAGLISARTSPQQNPNQDTPQQAEKNSKQKNATSDVGKTAATSVDKTQPGEAQAKQGPPPPNNPVKGPDETDKRFVKEAAIGNMFEIQMGQMAQEKAANPKVKQFGERMIKDHSNAETLLQGAAQTQHIALPTELDQAHQTQKSNLQSKSGEQFDRAYMQDMLHDHEKTVKQFQHESTASHDATIKQFAQGTLPILQSHLQEAKQIESEIGTPNPKTNSAKKRPQQE